VRLADAVASRLRAGGFGARTVTLKVRFAGFETITRSTTLPAPVDTAHAIVAVCGPMLATVDPGHGVRLVGVSCSNFGPVAEQLSMDALLGETAGVATAGEWQAAEETLDAIRSKFGSGAIGPASAMAKGSLRLVRKGAQQWGPDQH
jgi:DNA polymerase-4